MVVARGVSKKFGEKQVLTDISFHLAPRECVGLIGRNGAGKTTLLHMLSGVLKPDSGFLRVCGSYKLLQEPQIRRQIAYVSGQTSQLWEDMKLSDSFDNCAKMAGLGKKEYGKWLGELSEALGLKDFLHIPVTKLSLGERMRGELAYALLARPALLFLDEALVGMDTSAKAQAMRLLEQLKEEKETTIIYTSHNLADVETFCERALLLDGGRILFDGEIENLMEESAPEYRMEIRIEGPFPDLEDLPVEGYTVEKNVLCIRFRKQKVEGAEIVKHVMGRCAIVNIAIEEPNLETVIKAIYAEGERQ